MSFDLVQLQFGPRRKPGIGLTDGETMERLWSFLRQFSSISKQMLPERRMDLLTDALIHYALKLARISVCRVGFTVMHVCHG